MEDTTANRGFGTIFMSIHRRRNPSLHNDEKLQLKVQDHVEHWVILKILFVKIISDQQGRKCLCPNIQIWGVCRSLN